MINSLSNRTLYAVGFLTCAALIGAALYFQYVLELEPCPLCIFQRICIIVVGVLCLIALLHNPDDWGRRVYALLVLIASGIGAAIATRHVWLQNLPEDQVPECGPDLTFMLDRFPLWDVVGKVLSGSGECAEVLWRFLGLSIPGWTLVVFAGFILVAGLMFFRRSA